VLSVFANAFKDYARAFFDDNDEKAIWWDEDAYITWDAFDGYLVEVESEKK